jgi:hypothetical protein
MLSVIRPDFEVVREGWILLDYLSFLLLLKVSGVRSSFAKLHPLPSPETIPEATRISLVTSGKLEGLNSLNLVPDNVNGI